MHKIFVCVWITLWGLLWVGTAIITFQILVQRFDYPILLLITAAAIPAIIPVAILFTGQLVVYSYFAKGKYQNWHKYVWSSLFPILYVLLTVLLIVIRGRG